MNETLRTIIIDDERFFRDELEALLSDHCPEVKVVGTAGSVDEAKKVIPGLAPDFIFLDVNMPGRNGFDLLEDLSEEVPVVFVTAYERHAVRAFKAAALHYLIKPCQPDELKVAVDRVRSSIQRQVESTGVTGEGLAETLPAATDAEPPSRIAIAHRNGFHFPRFSEIIYLESAGSYTIFHCEASVTLTASRPIGFYEAKLPHAGFLRIHRSYVINLRWVKGYVSDHAAFVELSGDVKLEISKSRLKDFLARMVGSPSL